MKKILSVLLLSVLLFSCSADEELQRTEETNCDCAEVQEKAINPTYDFPLPITWTPTGTIQPTSFGCAQNGYAYVYEEGYSTNNSGYWYKLRWRVVCE